MTDSTMGGESITTKLPTEGADLLTLAGVADGNLSELQRLFPVRATLRGEQLTLTGTPDAVEKAAQVAQRLGVKFTVLLDTDKAVVKRYDLGSMPGTVLIDRDGRVRYLHRGYRDGMEADYERQIRELVKE